MYGFVMDHSGEPLTTAEKWKIAGGFATLAFIAVTVLVWALDPNREEAQPVKAPTESYSAFGSYEDRYGNFHDYYPDDEYSEDEHFMYRNCDEARAYGAAPVYEGDPGFGPHLDRDGDGIGCEPWNEY